MASRTWPSKRTASEVFVPVILPALGTVPPHRPVLLGDWKETLPNLNWGFLSGELHTVVLGYNDDWRDSQWVMDILLFKEKSADESIDFVKSRDWQFYSSLPEYMASFFDDPEAVLAAWPEQLLVSPEDDRTVEPSLED